MNKIISFLALGLILLPAAAFAENRSVLDSANPGKAAPFSEVADEFKNRREVIQEDIRVSNQEFKERIEAEREKLKETLEAKRMEMKTKLEASRTELKAKLSSIRDEGKKEAVTRIDERIAALNEKLMQHFTNVLERLENVLQNIVARIEKADTNSLDTTAVKEKVMAAEAAIAAAREAIKVQSGKVYSIQITTESALRNNVGAARNLLHNDLTRVREAVFAARETVRSVIQILKAVPRISDFESSSTE